MNETNATVRTRFRTRTLPVPARLAGYAWLIERHSLSTILPYQLHVTATINTSQRTPDCVVHPVSRHPRREMVFDHLVFAMKNEGVNLLVLKQVFGAVGPEPLNVAVAAKPTSAYARRLCFFYEWLTGACLEAPSSVGGNYVEALDPKHQYVAERPRNESKWRVRDNLPGSPAFCPLIAKTSKIDAMVAADLSEQAGEIVRSTPKEVLTRAAAFLLLNDSRASFEIEREKPTKDRAQRWAAVIGRAGEAPLSADALLGLQEALIEDDRFVTLGFRQDGGFVGEHTPFGEPRPDHISAPPEDLADLIRGLIVYDEASASKRYDPVLSAAALAFGFVYIHPFEDGNGRLHRYLIHHVLSRRDFLPHGVSAPVSSAILADLIGYRHTLETLSQPLLRITEWRPTQRGNVEVLNSVADYYRYFDATPHAEFLFDCLERTILKELPDELRFLSARDQFHRRSTTIVDMPERLLDILFHMLRRQGGRFTKRMRRKEFASLTDEEAAAFETIYAEEVNEIA